MTVQMYVGVTAYKWYKQLQALQADEANWWQPTDLRNFNSIEPGQPFLFKLHAPRNYIVGGGIFRRQMLMPASLMWDAFGVGNGYHNLAELMAVLYRLRKTDRYTDPNPQVSCLLIHAPFFFPEADWIPIPADWAPTTGQGKTYDSATPFGAEILTALQARGVLQTKQLKEHEKVQQTLGSGSFVAQITRNYHYRCAIMNAGSLPALRAVHIMPPANGGAHISENGLLLRRDIAVLFEQGYLTISDEYVVKISQYLQAAAGGQEYRALHGQRLINLPALIMNLPSRELLRWHNEYVFIG